MIEFKTHDLIEHHTLSHGFFGRKGGLSTGVYDSLNAGYGSADKVENITENRKRIARAIGCSPPHLLSLWQHHSTDVVIVDAPFKDMRPKADGLVTQTPGIALSALAADCGPVLLHDPESGTIGACHAGWRGALDGITESTIEAMERSGAKRENIRAVLGPCISQISYEVGPEFKSRFILKDKNTERFFRPGPAKANGERRAHFDLKGFILARLAQSGLIHISALTDCTYANPHTYYSYRYNTHHGLNDYGRNISTIMLIE